MQSHARPVLCRGFVRDRTHSLVGVPAVVVARSGIFTVVVRDPSREDVEQGVQKSQRPNAHMRANASHARGC